MISKEKTKHIANTKAIASYSRHLTGAEQIEIENMTLSVHPNVFHPGKFFSSEWFAKVVTDQLHDAITLCEVGCGTGIVSLSAASHAPQLLCTCLDINPAAIENTRENSSSLHLSERVSARQSDVFSTLRPDERFDLLFWALPFGFLEEGTSIDMVDAQTFDPGYRAIERFLAEAATHLTEQGRILIGFSREIGDEKLLMQLLKKHGYTSTIVNEIIGTEIQPVTMELMELKKVK